MTRLDIAYEEVEEILSNEDLHHEVRMMKGIQIHQIDIHRQNKVIQNDPGRYMTIEFGSLQDIENRQILIDVTADCLKELLPQNCRKVLVAGLGNQYVTADSLGPDTAQNVFVTAHLSDEIRGTCPKIAVIAPGVMGQTGLETARIIQALCNSEKPDLVIAVDALATKSIRRINHVIQITDTGIHPGSGVKNKRLGLTEQTLGVKVISLGVATVMSVQHLIEEKLKESGADEVLNRLSEDVDMVVTPKEIDEIKVHLAEVLSSAINQALIPDLSSR